MFVTKTNVMPDENGREYTAQEAAFLDRMELGRNEVVGKMKSRKGKGHASGPSLKRAHKRRIG